MTARELAEVLRHVVPAHTFRAVMHRVKDKPEAERVRILREILAEKERAA